MASCKICHKENVDTMDDFCMQCITENTSNAADEMDMTVNVSKWIGSGIHTIYIQLKKANGDETSSSSLTMEYLK